MTQAFRQFALEFPISGSGRQGHVHKPPLFSVSFVPLLSYSNCLAFSQSPALVTSRKTTVALYMPCRYRYFKKRLIIFLSFRSATLWLRHQHFSAELEFAGFMIDANQLHFHFIAFFQHTFHALETLM
jgi:hypothetical protein